MNQKELGEIRRRFRPDRNNIQHIYGCYVNTSKEIITSFDESLGLLSETEAEKYLTQLTGVDMPLSDKDIEKVAGGVCNGYCIYDKW